MGTSSTKNLTKYSSGTTIVTADVANSWFGGLNGSYEGSLLDIDDPRVIGHVHDGENYDGHSGKIDLVNHVKSKLQHQNLADLAVEKNNVATFASQLDAIPETDIDGNYYLNLSSVYDYIDAEVATIESPFEFVDTNSDSVDDTVRQSNTDYNTTGLDFVYGSSKLDDMNDGFKGDERFLFDKSKGAFRAGSVSSTQWNDSNRGQYSVALGRNGKASGTASFAAGSDAEASGINSFAAGASNVSSGNNSASFGTGNVNLSENSLVTGNNNSVAVGPSNLVSGKDHNISATACLISGVDNVVEGEYNAVTGYLCDVDDDGNIVSGYKNNIRGDFNAVFGSENNSKNDGAVTANSSGSLVAGNKNQTSAPFAFIAGQQNQVNFGANYSAVFGNDNGAIGRSSLLSGESAVSKVRGEVVHASGKFLSPGDAQSSRYVVRGKLANPIGPPGLPLTVDGVLQNYIMDLNAAYNITVNLVGKLAGPSQECGTYKLEAMGIGPVSGPPSPGSVSAPIITYISRTPYFVTGGLVNVTLTVSGGNTLIINVSDNHIAPNFYPSSWVGTVTLTTCKF